jgi:hypothetical protein
MGTAVQHAGAVHQFPLQETGEGLAHGGRGAVAGAEVKGSDALRVRRCVRVGVQAEHQIRTRVVGEGSALGLRGAVVRAAGEQRFHAGGDHPAFQALGKVPHQLGLGDTLDHRATVRAAVGGIDDDPLAAQRRARSADLLLLSQIHRPSTADLEPELA